LPEISPNFQFSFTRSLGLRGETRTGQLGLGRFWPESASRVALRPIGAGEFALPCQLLNALLCVLRARQRREESDDVPALCLAQGKGLDIIL